MRALLFGVMAFALASVSSCGGSEPEPDPRVARGSLTYDKYCGLCHGNQGQGYVADNANALAHPQFLATAPDELLRRGIARGRPGTTMSAWGAARGGPLSDVQVDELVAFLRFWQRGETLAVHDRKVLGEPSRVESLYTEECRSCHGARGAGGRFMSIGNPELLVSASDGFLRHAIANGRGGTPMPGFAGTLSDQQIDDLVMLIRSWQRPPNDEALQLPDATAPAVIHPAGPEATFAAGRFAPVDDVKREYDRGARLVIIDARPPADYVLEHITGAISVPFYDVDKHVARLPKDTWIIAYCGCPHAESGAAIDALAARGFTKGKVLDEGVFVWKGRGYPMTAGPKP